jgi:hypothetical protein
MQDTLSVAVRTFVTITSLVAVPLVAVLGASHPRTSEWLDRLRQDGPAQASLLGAGPTDDTVDDDAPAAAAPPGLHSSPRRPARGRQVPVFWSDGGAVESHASTDFSDLSDNPPGSAPVGVAAIDDRSDADDDRPQPLPGDASPRAPAADEPFAALAARLRELGATHYRLETWGTDGGLFRFRCLMAVPGQPRQSQHFEATAEQPLDAMAQVLDQVEPWYAEHLAAVAPHGPAAAFRR